MSTGAKFAEPQGSALVDQIVGVKFGNQCGFGGLVVMIFASHRVFAKGPRFDPGPKHFLLPAQSLPQAYLSNVVPDACLPHY